ncbi:Lysozyme-like domain-containing protein [Dinothrombium tinctorium]|uniref:Lysozyme-like domain-containing protein n=1 Tax=Dinothrombium tinctorium TaxID=1965070 RepID=A0A443QW18_9ACAR|nr:Lysozyme-like domain-containing protein [Dinothrombium tinctorium]
MKIELEYNEIKQESKLTECWWSGCQPYDWAERGCFPSDVWQEVNSTACDIGDKYYCCKKPNAIEVTTKRTTLFTLPANLKNAIQLTSECWWSGCQLDYWAEKGCFPEGEWFAVNSTYCDGGKYYKCCRKVTRDTTTTTLNPVAVAKVSKEIDISWQEFEKAVEDSGFGTRPTFEQYEAVVSQCTKKGAITSKLELAMFMAQILWESGGLRYKREIGCEKNECANIYDNSVGLPDKAYYGRGYMMLTHSYNYKAASHELYGDNRLIEDPDLVADDEQVAWATAFWFWKRNVHNAPGVQEGKFGVTTRKINGAFECKGQYKDRARRRFKIYKKILIDFNIKEKANEKGCYN